MHCVTQHRPTYRRAWFGLAGEDEEEFFAWRREQFCTIGHDAWIGHGAVVIPGVKVGIGAAVGSGAVVTEEVRPYEVVVGVPARPVRRRFSDRDIERLLATEWWNWDRQTLEAHWPDLCDLETFLEKFS
jgi:acetyltransferase-like isoleucine patch superfamily enzyme